MSDTSLNKLEKFAKSLREKQQYFTVISPRYSNIELDCSKADLVKAILDDFEKLLAQIMYDSKYTSTDPYVTRLLKKETQRREFLSCEGMPTSVITMNMF